MKFSRAILIVYGLMFLYFGVLLFFRPGDITSMVPITLDDRVAIAEIRTFYGGLEIGLGAFLLFTGIRRSMVKFGLWLLIAVSAGLTLGRVTGVMWDEARGAFIFSALAIEAGGFMLSVAGLRALRHRSP